MKRRYSFPILILCFIFLAVGLQASNLRQGYIVTKTNHHLTGYIGDINHTEFGSMVEFVNDFGTPYFLHPALIKGFAFLEGPVFREYESRFWRRQWMFLQVIYPGEDVRLLKSPDFITSYQIINGQLSSNTKEKAEYWIDIPGRRFIPVKRWGFRRNMRRLVEEVSPNLADKIGQAGYRYKDLVSIIQEYDRIMRQGTRRL